MNNFAKDIEDQVLETVMKVMNDYCRGKNGSINTLSKIHSISSAAIDMVRSRDEKLKAEEELRDAHDVLGLKTKELEEAKCQERMALIALCKVAGWDD